MAAAALLCLGAVVALYLVHDMRQPVPADYETLELFIIPIALFAAIASLIRKQELRLGLLAGAIGGLLIVGFVTVSQSLGFLYDRSYLRADALAWGLLLLIVVAYGLAWWEARLPWRPVVGSLAIGGVAGALIAYALYGLLAVVVLTIHPFTF